MALSRRALLAGVSIGGAMSGAAMAQPLIDSHALQDILLVPSRPPINLSALIRPRLNVASLSASSKTLVSFRKAIAAMTALPASNPRSWEAQAQRHSNSCAHRNWYTWPWHRAFLLQFEEICQTLSGDSDFRVPYWNWTAQRQMPATFTQATFNGSPNPLFHARAQSPTASLGDAVVGQTVVDAILAEPNFEAFMSRRPAGQNNTNASWQRTASVQGQMESNPHNTIHGWIGQDMASFLSPRDPLFWLHHSNLDRLWERWNKLGNANTTDPLWRDFQFSNQFVTVAGAPWAPRVKELLNIGNLFYTYDQPLRILPPIAKLVPNFDWALLRRVETPLAANLVANRLQVADITLRTPLPIADITARSRAATVPKTLSAQAVAPEVKTAGRVLAFIDASIPENAPAPQVRVFLNCDYLSAETPSVDPHYVGSFSFFGMPMAQHAGMTGGDAMSGVTQFMLDLTRTLVALGAAGTPPDQLKLQFQPIGNGVADPPTPVTILKVEIAVS